MHRLHYILGHSLARFFSLGSRSLHSVLLCAFLLLGGSMEVCAQEDVEEAEAQYAPLDSGAAAPQPKISPLDTIPESARAIFDRYVQKEDTVKAQLLAKYRSNSFLKRLSFHTNAVDWATLVPNIGIEFDLKGTTRTQYSILLHAKYNGGSNAAGNVFNVNAVRIEGRKYWRTGKYGKAKEYHEDFIALCTDTADVAYFNADTLAESRFYVDDLGYRAKELGVKLASMRATNEMTEAEKDSLDFAEDSLAIKQRRFRRWVYNTYHKFRRNVTSGRTLSNPRNWRAYYLGVWAGADNFSICFSGKGKQGQGYGLGFVGGYTLPLFPQKYPHEGSLDLDLGLAIGWKAIKYDGYVFDRTSRHYVYDASRSRPTMGLVPYPLIQDIHVSLVWRFRGIKNKVDLSLVDDFEKYINAYESKRDAAATRSSNIKRQREDIEGLIRNRTIMMADSSSFWDDFHRQRLKAARELNPDTVFTGDDQVAYLRLIEQVPVKDQERYLREQELKKERADKEAAKLKSQQAKLRRDSINQERLDSIKTAKDAAKAAKAAAKGDKKAAKDSGKANKPATSVEPKDSVATTPVDLPTPVENASPTDSEGTEEPEGTEPPSEPDTPTDPEGTEEPESTDSPDNDSESQEETTNTQPRYQQTKTPNHATNKRNNQPPAMAGKTKHTHYIYK